jgi:16S rRNA (cytosine967-C5)-methyltransferase
LAKIKPNNARLISYELISQVNREGAFANLRLPVLLSESSMNLGDKAFTTELSYGTLRMQGRHDYLAGKYIDRPIETIDQKIVDLLRLGIHQICQMRVPDHAAVKETVEIAKFVAGESKASYVNAILRKVTQNGCSIPESKSWSDLDRLSIEFSHPKWIVQSFFDQLQDWVEVEKLLQANNQPVTPDLVCWPGKSSLEEVIQLGGEKISGLENGFTIPGIPSEFAPLVERRVGVQDRGSQLVVENFMKTSSEQLSWLDLCAGPGGKTAYISHFLKVNFPNSTFSANEVNPIRAELVKKVSSDSKVSVLDGTNPRLFAHKYDRILVDAPCTGLGALRRRPEARWRRTQNDLKELVKLQRNLLQSAYALLNPGGIIAYVTCSPHLLETKAQLLDFLGSFSSMELMNMNSLKLSNTLGIQESGIMQLWTHKDNSDSMFMALFRKRVSA